MRSDIVPGARFPDYELTDHTRTRRRLSELQGIDPMILILSRGHYCPKDHQQHLEMAAFYPKINVAYTKIVTISTDNILETNEFRDGVGAQWTFLSDSGRKVQQDLDIQEYTDRSGVAPRRLNSGKTCAKSRAKFARTGISQCQACVRTGKVIKRCITPTRVQNSTIFVSRSHGLFVKMYGYA